MTLHLCQAISLHIYIYIHTYTYTHTYIYTVFFHILFHDGLSQDIEYILCHERRHCSLSIPCIPVYICWSQTPNTPLLSPPIPLATTILFSMSVSLFCDRQFFILFYWSITDLPWCVNFFCTAKWFSYTYLLFSYFVIMVGHGRLYSSLCYTVGPCCVPSHR